MRCIFPSYFDDATNARTLIDPSKHFHFTPGLARQFITEIS